MLYETFVINTKAHGVLPLQPYPDKVEFYNELELEHAEFDTSELEALIDKYTMIVNEIKSAPISRESW